jgi:hypothetical protein
VLIALAELYIVVSDPTDLSFETVTQSLLHHFSVSAPKLIADGNEFRDIYIVLGTAGFTLYALFFIAVRRINSLTAARLVAISQGFGISFLLAVSAMMIPSEPWWRFALMTLLKTRHALRPGASRAFGVDSERFHAKSAKLLPFWSVGHF